MPIEWAQMPDHSWVFNARIMRVIDGDTVVVEVDGGFSNVQAETLRLWGVNTPEVVGASRAAGLAASAFVREWVAAHAVYPYAPDWPFRMRTIKGKDSFGRYLAILYARDTKECLNERLLTEGLAREDVR